MDLKSRLHIPSIIDSLTFEFMVWPINPRKLMPNEYLYFYSI